MLFQSKEDSRNCWVQALFRNWERRSKIINTLCTRIVILCTLYIANEKNGWHCCSLSTEQIIAEVGASPNRLKRNRTHKSWEDQHKKVKKRLEWDIFVFDGLQKEVKNINWCNCGFIREKKHFYIHSYVVVDEGSDVERYGHCEGNSKQERR